MQTMFEPQLCLNLFLSGNVHEEDGPLEDLYEA